MSGGKVNTVDYGVILFSSASLSTVEVKMTDSQVKEFKAFLAAKTK